jgi:ABC-2 type transport system permease protein
MENTYGMRFVMRVILEIAGGALIPLSFFPESLQRLFSCLPFPLLIFFPMRIYLGKILWSQMLWELLKEIAWIFALAGLNWLIWKRGLRQYVAMGD